MCVLVGVRGGLNIALTRSITLGAAEPELEANHRRATQVAAAMIAGTVPGRSYGEALQSGIEAYAAVGVAEEWREHYQGGAIGYNGREVSPAPLLRPNEESGVPVATGHAASWNPTVRGAKSEDTVLIRAEGPEVLTRTAEWPLESVAAGGATLELPRMLELAA